MRMERSRYVFEKGDHMVDQMVKLILLNLLATQIQLHHQKLMSKFFFWR